MSLEQLDDLYRDVILDHYRAPRHREELAHPDLATSGYNPVCGDQLTLQMRVREGRVEGVGVQTRGCSISVASGSMMAEAIRGKGLAEARALSRAVRKMLTGAEGEPGPSDSGETVQDIGDLEALAGVRNFPVRVKCALLAWAALDDVLRDGGPASGGRPVTTEGEEGAIARGGEGAAADGGEGAGENERR